ncbi:MAG: hypothetical protein LBV32_06745 [Tannerellaceae bacterium]|jgi:hypothetical protein|nr:hypothetical protein [Tannerellaceae bacterium]
MAKYSRKIVDDICTLIRMDSYTVTEICEKAGIAKDTYYNWLKTKPDFSDAIKKAQDEFGELMLSEAKKSLVKMIRGYTVQEKHTTTADTGNKDENGKPIVRVKEHRIIEKHYQPVPAAVIFALCNLDPDNWKNRQENKVSGDIGIKSSLETLSDEELQKIVDGETE